jgi:hypothetical protein
MRSQNGEEGSDWFAVIGRALCMLVLHAQDLNNASITDKAVLLTGLGLSNRDVGKMLRTSEASVRELLRKAKKSTKGVRSGERKKSKKKS